MSNILPNNKSIESSVISSIITGSGDYAIEMLTPDDFYNTNLASIFQAITKIDGRGMQLSRTNLLHELSVSGDFERWEHVVTDLVENTAHHEIEDAVRVLMDMSTRREIHKLCNITLGKVDKEEFSLDEIESSLYKIRDRKTESPIFRVGECMGEVFQVASDAKEGKVTYLKSGFESMDKVVPGFDRGDLTILAGRPSMGKTALALCIMYNIANEVPVLFFSLEMGKLQVTQRIMSIQSGLPLVGMRTGNMRSNEWTKMSLGAGYVDSLKLYIDDSSVQTLQSIRSKCRRAKYAHGLGMVVIDYLQLMDGPGENRQAQITTISRGLKALAKDFDIPVLALSQLSRKVEDRSDRTPIMSDLRESGAIEQDADVIMFVYRPYYYTKDEDQKYAGQVIVGKQRNGPVDETIHLEFVPHCARFQEYGSGETTNGF